MDYFGLKIGNSTLSEQYCGLTTSPITCGARTLQIDFDFIDHRLVIQTSEGAIKTLALEPRSVADFYKKLLANLSDLGIDVKIHTTPNEIADAIPFEKDHIHASYDAEYANRFWRVLVQVDRIFKKFRAGFLGKSSPVHFFWGSFDLALTRFSGRPAPCHPGGVPNLPNWVAREAYTHEVSSCGFWPGGGPVPYPVFYAYAYPEPQVYNMAKLHPDETTYNTELREFILPYDVVRLAQFPDAKLLDFLQSSYETAAALGAWDRSALERSSNCKSPASLSPTD